MEKQVERRSQTGDPVTAIVAEIVLEQAVRAHTVERLRREIDRALDERDREKFEELALLLRRLLSEESGKTE
ncbi:IDEAL domain-containing protein [Brockia lithotrophica]|nr:IDEAL domain-containing protein [Brockia lithotrophica]